MLSDIENVILHKGRYIKYFSIENHIGIYGMRVKIDQEHFSYFHNLFTSPTSELYHIVEYPSPKIGKDLYEVNIDSDDYEGGLGKLQFRQVNFSFDYNLYEFYTHTDIHVKQPTKQEILKSYKRMLSIDSLLN